MFISLIKGYSFKNSSLLFHTNKHSILSTNTLLLKPCRFSSQLSEKWLPWEDELLKNYVVHNGKKWSEFVQHCLPTRTPSQCQIRWADILNPNIKRGPFNETERNLLKKGVLEFGEGEWTKISSMYLPERSNRRIANEWANVSKEKRGKWTKEEDELLLKGYENFGKFWTKISNDYLPWRSRVQIRNHYQMKLNPNLNKEKWTEHELDLLLRRTIIFGQDWKKVAEGLPGRSPEKCNLIWLNQLDPGLNKGPWTKEETRLFWELMSKYNGSFSNVSKELPGRNRITCFKKFWSIVSNDKEFQLIYKENLNQEKDENRLEWKVRISKLVCDWFDKKIIIKKLKNNSIIFNQIGDSWNKKDLLKLNELVENKLKETKNKLTLDDWKEISIHFPERNIHQCKYQYEEHLLIKNVKKGYWTKEEDEKLLNLINEYGINNWNQIVKNIPNRTKRQCLYRWHRYLKFNHDNPPIIKNKRLTDIEKSLIKEGIQMFGPNWNAIRVTYLPERTPQQLMQWWNSQPKHNNDNNNNNNNTTIDEEEYDDVNHKSFWSEHEDNALKFAVNKYKNENGEISSWKNVAKMIHDRTPKQCRRRWMYSLNSNIKKGRWNYDEEMQLLEIVQKVKLQKSKTSHHSMWPLIAKELNTGRTDLACRSKYDYMQKKGHRFAF